MNVRVFEKDNKVCVVAPYNQEFPRAARALSGKWNRAARRWEFTAADINEVKVLVRRYYGCTGDEVTQDVEVSPPADTNWRKRALTLPIIDREVLYRPGRDLPVAPGEGVLVLAGEFKSTGGSARYPAIEKPHSDVRLRIKDVPAHVITAMREEKRIFYEEESENRVLEQIAQLLGCAAEKNAICDAVRKL